ncbi:MAG TPA: tyrosine--tRNA ligase [Nitrososphaeraceae archaeon]|nr:tyrosine--tRNA ligase [Nitrososphaeraceae archaeon]
MDITDRLFLITRDPTEEIITKDELTYILETVAYPKHYIGLELSGKLHLGSLILTGFKINDFIKAQIHSTVFLADWHTYINNKLMGDWDKIKEVSKYYYDAFKFFCPGVNILLGSEIYENSPDYWENFVRFSKHMTLSRITRSLTIMGRSERDALDFSQLLYPIMQSVDIRALDLDIVHAGMDQRKIHMLVREVFPRLGWKIPVCLHHHLLPGLSEPVKLGLSEDTVDDVRISSKMSKSKPTSGIIIHDDENTIREKINRAFCPIGIVERNPILELIRYVIFHEFEEFNVERPLKYGGNIIYTNYYDVEKDFISKNVHPMDLKNSTATYINKIIEPIRNYFHSKEQDLQFLQ